MRIPRELTYAKSTAALPQSRLKPHRGWTDSSCHRQWLLVHSFAIQTVPFLHLASSCEHACPSKVDSPLAQAAHREQRTTQRYRYACCKVTYLCAYSESRRNRTVGCPGLFRRTRADCRLDALDGQPRNMASKRQHYTPIRMHDHNTL